MVFICYIISYDESLISENNFMCMQVEYSLESGFKVGMQLEVPHREKGECYWIASVVMTCGELLSLRYIGYGDDRSGDFWFNIKSGEFHPVGWCKANFKKLYPPEGTLGLSIIII